jgi:hypothetical protein
MIYPHRTMRHARALPVFGGLGLGLGRPRSSTPSYLLYDTFTDSDGTNLTAHTMNTGSGWTSLFGTWVITSNRAVRSTSGDNEVIVADAGATNVTATVTANIGAAQSFAWVGLVVRATDNSNYWLGLIQTISSPSVQLYEKSGGSYTLRDSSTPVVTTSTDYNLKLVASGTTITFYIDNVQVATYASMATGLSATKCGIGASAINPTTRTFNDFAVVSP